MQAENIYKNYRVTKARLEFLTEKAKEMEQTIILMKQNILTDNQRLTACLDGISSKTCYSNPTQNIAVMMADGTTPAIQREEKSLQLVRDEIATLYKTIRYADIFLSSIDKKEQFVIRAHLINGCTWNETSVKFEREFLYPYTVDGLRKLQKRALEKIESIFYDQVNRNNP